MGLASPFALSDMDNSISMLDKNGARCILEFEDVVLPEFFSTYNIDVSDDLFVSRWPGIRVGPTRGMKTQRRQVA